MKVTERINKFLNFMAENLENDIDYEEDEINNIEKVDNSPKTRKREKKLKSEEKLQKRKLRIEKKVKQKYDSYDNNIKESMTLLKKLELIKMQLKNEELTPWRRLILQIKFSRIQTKLDKQIAYLDIEKFKEQCNTLKNSTIINVVDELENNCREYNEILDEQYQAETQVEELMRNIKEVKTSANAYKYQTKPENIVNVNVRNDQLEDILRRKEEKEQQIREIYEKGQQRYNQINKTMNNKLRKYNPLVIQWNAIKTFFGHVAQNVAEWWQNKRIEKDAQKGLSKEEKKDRKMEVRKSMANMRNAENETIVENFRARLHYNTLENEPEEQQEEPKQVVEQGNKESEIKGENFTIENEVNPIVLLYIEESEKEGFDESKFYDKYIWSQTTSYTVGQIEDGMQKIECYKEKHNTQQEELSEEEIKRRKAQEYFKKQEALRQELNERQARLKGKKFEYKNNNYVVVEEKEDEKSSTEQEER